MHCLLVMTFKSPNLYTFFFYHRKYNYLKNRETTAEVITYCLPILLQSCAHAYNIVYFQILVVV